MGGLGGLAALLNKKKTPLPVINRTPNSPTANRTPSNKRRNQSNGPTQDVDIEVVDDDFENVDDDENA